MKFLKIPFFANSANDSRCVHACVKMALKYYLPQKNYSFRAIDKMLNYKEGNWIWKPSIAICLSNFGFSVQVVDAFNYRFFSQRGEDYLKEIWTKEVLTTQKEHSCLETEQEKALLMLTNSKIKHFERPATIKDIQKFLENGYFVIASINPYPLYGEEGYAGHSVVILGIDSNEVLLHDPGIPPEPNLRTSLKTFKKSFYSPTKDYSRLIAIKPSTT